MTKVTPITAAGTNAPQTTPAEKQDQVIIVFQGTPKKEEKPKEYNVYGGDIANFEHFKKDDQHDAMRLTTSYAADIKRAYMQLKHDFPDANIVFETMPDPKKCGKKREGFFTYQQQLEIWKNTATDQINNARELCTAAKIEEEAEKTRATVVAAADAVATNDDLNTLILLDEQDDNAAELQKATAEEGAKTRAAVHGEAAQTRKTVKVDGAVTRAVTAAEGAITRGTNHIEHEQTRATVQDEGYYTRRTVRQESGEIQDKVEKEGKSTRRVVREEGAETRKKVQEGIEIDDPTGRKRLIHKTKEALGF